jgi:predicted ester cyclase
VVEVNKQVVRRFYEELWNRGNFRAADDLVSADYVRHDLRPGEAPPGPEGQKAVAQRFREAFPDVTLEVEALVAEGDVVAARWTISGTHTGA